MAGPHDLVLALIVELAEEQLTVGAIHRTISRLPHGFDLVSALSVYCDVVRAGAADGGGGSSVAFDPDLVLFEFVGDGSRPA